MKLLQRLAGWLLALGLLSVGLVHTVWQPLPLLDRLDRAWDDWRQLLLLPEAPSAEATEVVIVDIDEASLAREGRWPWSRQRLARLIEELTQRQKVAGIGLDVVFPEAEACATSATACTVAPDALLAQALKDQPVVLGFYLRGPGESSSVGVLPDPLWRQPLHTWRLPHWPFYTANLPTLAESTGRGGFFNFVPDGDGLVRSVPALATTIGPSGEAGTYASLAFRLWLLALGDPLVNPLSPPGLELQPAQSAAVLWALQLGDSAADQRLMLGEGGRLRIPYQGPAGREGRSFRYVSAHDLLARRLSDRELSGKLVLIGSSAPGLADLRATAVHPALPGVEIHAHLLAGLLSGHLPTTPDWSPAWQMLSLGLSLLASVALMRLASARLALGGCLALLVGQLWLNLQMARSGLMLPVATPVGLTLVFILSGLGRNYLAEWRSRQSLVMLLGQYLPPQRARELAEQGASLGLQAKNAEISILFCDIRGFSGQAEQLSPTDLRTWLNLYFSHVTSIVHAHGGTLDKFIGDAVMAFWGAPQPQADHALRATQAALALVKSLPELNAGMKTQQLPEISLSVGVATGLVCVGDLGSNARRSYTAVGDAVNLAARLQGLAAERGEVLLLAEATKCACEQMASSMGSGSRPTPPAQVTELGGLSWQEVVRTRVRGREQVEVVYRLTDVWSNAAK